jgi:hypothetical protein
MVQLIPVFTGTQPLPHYFQNPAKTSRIKANKKFELSIETLSAVTSEVTTQAPEGKELLGSWTVQV